MRRSDKTKEKILRKISRRLAADNPYLTRARLFRTWAAVIRIAEAFLRGLEVKKIEKTVFCALIFVVRGGNEVGVVTAS